MPWGRPQERDRPFWKDAGHAVVSFGKGVVVDGLWGGVKGVGTLVNPWSDQFGASWEGLGKLGLALTPLRNINEFTSLPGLKQGELDETLVATGKGLVAWDTWKTDPARAAGVSLTNIVTAVVGTKGAGVGAVRAGEVGAAALPKVAAVRASVAARLAETSQRIELAVPRLSPAFAGGSAPGRFQFDVELPATDTSRMHNEAAPGGHGDGVPRTTEASVASKMENYLLQPDHPVGRTKAEWFRRALGFTSENSGELIRQVRFDPQLAVPAVTTKYGQKFEQLIEITGPTGRTIGVQFVWIRNVDGVVRLVTAIPTR